MIIRLLALLLIGSALISAAALPGGQEERKRDGTWVAVAME